MTTIHYKGVALCFNTARLKFYNDACVTVDKLANYGTYTTGPSRKFNCFGVAMGLFYDQLVEGGEEDICVCSFYSPDGAVSPWQFVNHWGPCNGACVSKTFTCDGMTPVAHNGDEKVKRDDDENENENDDDDTAAATAVVSEELPLLLPSAERATDTSTTPSSLAAPLAANWKAVAVIVTITLCHALL
jgi:hypothetical protein